MCLRYSGGHIGSCKMGDAASNVNVTDDARESAQGLPLAQLQHTRRQRCAEKWGTKKSIYTRGGHWRKMSEGGGHFTLLHGYNYNNYCRKNGIRITKK